LRYEDFAGSKFEIELYRAIAAKRLEISESLCVGTPQNYEDYRFFVGYLAALKDMNDVIVAVRKKLNK
jgi:hypothetical protein